MAFQKGFGSTTLSRKNYYYESKTERTDIIVNDLSDEIWNFLWIL